MINAEQIWKEIVEFEQLYTTTPSASYGNKTMMIAKKVYEFGQCLYEEKKTLGFALSDQDYQLYDMCKAQKTKCDLSTIKQLPVDSDQLMRIKETFLTLATQFPVNKEKITVIDRLNENARQIMPNILNSVKKYMIDVDDLSSKWGEKTTVDAAKAQKKAAYYQVNSANVNKTLVGQMIDYSKMGYDGYKSNLSHGFKSLTLAQVPESLKKSYNESKGLFDDGAGLCVWLGMKGREIVVAFSGTKLSSMSMLVADVQQIFFVSPLYVRAAALLKELLELYKTQEFFITGHSLGGGLTQFALVANCEKHASRMKGYAFNPAGLSYKSLKYISDQNLRLAKDKIQVFMTPLDPVSCVGAKLGYLVTLPSAGVAHSMHSLSDVEKCYNIYVGGCHELSVEDITNNTSASDTLTSNFLEVSSGNSSAAKASNLFGSKAITVKGYFNDFYDIEPYIFHASLSDLKNNTVWSIFNPSSKLGAKTDFVCGDVSKKMLDILHNQNDGKVADIVDFYNGTSFSALNRLLLLAREPLKREQISSSEACSVIIYGFYGLGKARFARTLQKAFVESEEAYSVSRSVFELAVANLLDPYDLEIGAWVYILKNEMGITNAGLVETNEVVRTEFIEWLKSFDMAKERAYEKRFSKTPSAENKRLLKEDLKTLAVSYTNDIIDRAVQYSHINAEQGKNIKYNISYFCNII